MANMRLQGVSLERLGDRKALLGQFDAANTGGVPNLWKNSHAGSGIVQPRADNPSRIYRIAITAGGLGGNLLHFDGHVEWMTVTSLDRVGKDNPYTSGLVWMYSRTPPL